jgi:putative acetyltransferase
MLRIAEATPADLEDVLSIERAAFNEPDVAELVRELLDDASAEPRLSLLAWDGERPVGHILFTAARLEGASREVAISILAPLAVVPDAQGKGVGGSLIEHGIRRLEESGVELVFVLGHPGYYPRHGFVPAIRQGLFAQYPISPEEAWMVRALRQGVVGSERGTVVCSDAMNRPEHWRE